MISAKQKIILAFPYSKYDALICDGAVRSGKTSIMMWSFVRWAMESFNGQRADGRQLHEKYHRAVYGHGTCKREIYDPLATRRQSNGGASRCGDELF